MSAFVGVLLGQHGCHHLLPGCKNEEDPIKGVLESREHLTCFQTQYSDGSYVDGFDECHYSSFFRQYLMPSLGSLTSSDCVSRCLLSASVELSPPR